MESADLAFHYQDYRAYLHGFLSESPRGTKLAMANALRCQPGFVTQILGGEKQLSLEQAYAFAGFVGLEGAEREYFLMLVQKDRAGTPELRGYFLSKLSLLKSEKSSLLKNRLKTPRAVKGKDLVDYYSAWYYSAIHVSLSIPGYRTPTALARALGLSLTTVMKALVYLEKVGFAEKRGDEHHIGGSFIHLAGDDPLVGKHHTNWRLKTLQALESGKERSPEDVHFSSVVTVSEKDAQKIQAKLVAFLEEIQTLVKNSPEEETRALCIDFFSCF